MTMKRILFSAAAILLLAAASCSRYETVAGDPLEARICTLDNGLKIYMTVNRDEPRIQTYIAVRVGGKDDPSQWGYTPHAEKSISGTITCDFSKNGYRLPTEAEWEYAARGGKAGCEAANPTDWAGTDSEAELGKYAWYDSNSNSKTHEVKTEKQAGVNSANSLGLYDMSGNVWEWCWDWKNEDVTINDNAYKVGGVVTNPAGASSGSSRVYRGGGWNVDAYYCSVARRNGNSPDVRISSFLGFRVVRTAN